MEGANNHSAQFVANMANQFWDGNSTTSQPKETECPDQEPVWQHLGILLTVVDSTVAMMALLGNGLVIASVLKYPSLRSATNMFVVSLAVADLLVGICIPYYVLFYFTDLEWICDYWPCLVRYFTVLCSTVASMLSNVGVAVDRYLAVVHPLAYPRLIGQWRVPVAIALGWMYVIIITALPFAVNTWDEANMKKCKQHIIECDLYYMSSAWYVGLAVGSHVLLTLVITTGLYLRIFREAWRQLHSVAILQPHPRLHYEARTARVMALVLGVCLISLAPYLTAISLPYHDEASTMDKCQSHSWRVFKKLAVCFYLGKSSLNPLIYGWKNTEFRSAFCRLLRLPYSDKDMVSSKVMVFSITKLNS